MNFKRKWRLFEYFTELAELVLAARFGAFSLQKQVWATKVKER